MGAALDGVVDGDALNVAVVETDDEIDGAASALLLCVLETETVAVHELVTLGALLCVRDGVASSDRVAVPEQLVLAVRVGALVSLSVGVEVRLPLAEIDDVPLLLADTDDVGVAVLDADAVADRELVLDELTVGSTDRVIELEDVRDAVLL